MVKTVSCWKSCDWKTRACLKRRPPRSVLTYGVWCRRLRQNASLRGARHQCLAVSSALRTHGRAQLAGWSWGFPDTCGHREKSGCPGCCTHMAGRGCWPSARSLAGTPGGASFWLLRAWRPGAEARVPEESMARTQVGARGCSPASGSPRTSVLLRLVGQRDHQPVLVQGEELALPLVGKGAGK